MRVVMLDSDGVATYETAPADQAARWSEPLDGDFEMDAFPLVVGGVLAIEVESGASRFKANCAVEPPKDQVVFFVVRPLMEEGKRVETTETDSPTHHYARSESEPTELLVGITISPSPDYPQVSG